MCRTTQAIDKSNACKTLFAGCNAFKRLMQICTLDSQTDSQIYIPCSRLLPLALSVSSLSEMGEALHDIAPGWCQMST